MCTQPDVLLSALGRYQQKGESGLAGFLVEVAMVSLCCLVGMEFCHGETITDAQSGTADISILQLWFDHMTGLCVLGKLAEERLLESNTRFFGFSSFPWGREDEFKKEVNLSSKPLRFHLIGTPDIHKNRTKQTGFWCSKSPNNLVLGSGVKNQLCQEAYFLL